MDLLPSQLSAALQRVDIPADFLFSQVQPTWADIAWGYKAGLLHAQTVVDSAVARVGREGAGSSLVVELASLLPDDLYRVRQLAGALALDNDEASAGRAEETWLFVLLAWGYENRDLLDDPLGFVEAVYSDFSCPEEISHLVRYMPLAPGADETGGSEDFERRLFSEWAKYLRDKRAALAE